jgi:DNA-binding transcriptional ArsR family regulator
MAFERRIETDRRVRLLDLDPELGLLLEQARLEQAQEEIRVRVARFGIGEWDAARLRGADPAHIGLLLVEGVIALEVVIEDIVSTELLGPGDVVRPWRIDGPPELLPVILRWNALSPIQFALIDQQAGVQLTRYPELGAAIVDRLAAQHERAAIMQAIAQLNRVERRLVALFWHLAERWGRVARDGIALPLALPHRLLGELIGARRPTVSTALAELAERGQVVRRDDGTWLITGEPPEPVADEGTDLVRQRRRLEPASQPAEEPVDLVVEPSERLRDLQRTLARVRETADTQSERFRLLEAETLTLRERTAQLRVSRADHLEALRNAARARDA